MDAIDQTQVFFLISSIGFVVLWVLFGVLLFYLIRISRTFSRIVDKAEEDINNIGDMTKEILEEIRGNSLFKFASRLFRKKRRVKKDSN